MLCLQGHLLRRGRVASVLEEEGLALLAEGVLPDDPGAFARKVADLMGR